jgi:nitrite reductase/ring-hydroxylating ferredoxin subunit
MEPIPGSSTKALWREEFSVHSAEDAYVLRRQFTKFLVLTSFGMLAGNAWIWLRSLAARGAPPAPEVVVAHAAEVPVGGVKLFSYPGPTDPCILVHVDRGHFVAYSQKCTHLSCAVYYAADARRLECPCHEGHFSVETGRVLQGPPPRPLPRIELRRDGERIVATGVTLNPDDHHAEAVRRALDGPRDASCAAGPRRSAPPPTGAGRRGRGDRVESGTGGVA